MEAPSKVDGVLILSSLGEWVTGVVIGGAMDRFCVRSVISSRSSKYSENNPGGGGVYEGSGDSGLDGVR